MESELKKTILEGTIQAYRKKGLKFTIPACSVVAFRVK